MEAPWYVLVILAFDFAAFGFFVRGWLEGGL